VCELILQGRHVTYREIEASLGIGMTSVNKVLHENLTVKNICPRWILRLTKAHENARFNWGK
jgi:hypothetical protein